ncbi:MAG TPA: BLUF domain-containing protein, partial [Verrucomicrobiae bacterium]|nr:BLUF domain-containing protein [Verrucomicrobiae bacterium]
ELLAQSRRRNALQNITGLLLYHRGGFIQVLEGPESSVQVVFESILRDPRHHSIIKVLEGSIEEREFASWSMASRQMDGMEGSSDFLSTPWSGQEFSADPGRCQKLLLKIKRELR